MLFLFLRFYLPRLFSSWFRRSLFNMRFTCVAAILFVLLCDNFVNGQVLGIDFGDAYVKVAYIFGKKKDILLNANSQRKTANALFFQRDGTRLLGDEAAIQTTKYPKFAFIQTTDILGKAFSNNDTNIGPNGYPKAYYPYEYAADKSREVYYLKVNETLNMYPEELSASILQYVKRMATSHLGLATNAKMACVISIPCTATQRFRQAIVDAAELADLEVLSLVHGLAAAAVHHLFGLPANSSQTTLLYDLGSNRAEVGVIRYSYIASAGNTSDKIGIPSVQLLSCASEKGLGGHSIDIALAEYMRKEFETLKKVSIEKNSKAMKKFLKEAERAKHYLNIAKHTMFSIDTVTDGIPFSRKLTIKDLAEILKSNQMLEKLLVPVNNALTQANVTLKQIDTVEIIGGNSRLIPIHETLSEILKPHKLGRQLNGDEAIAMGNAFIAANYSASFIVTKIWLIDATIHSYRVHIVELQHSNSENNNSKIEKNVELFKSSKLSGMRTITFSETTDLQVTLKENDNLLASYEITGISEAVETKFKNLGSPKISIVFKADSLGIIRLDRAFATFFENIPVTSNSTPTLHTNTSISSSDDACTIQVKSPNLLPNMNNVEMCLVSEEMDQKNSQSNPDNDLKNTQPTPVAAPKKHVVDLSVFSLFYPPKPLNSSMKLIASKALARQFSFEREAAIVSENRNALEKETHFVHNSLEDDKILNVANEAQLKNLSNTLADVESWMEKEAAHANASVLAEKRLLLSNMISPMVFRAEEYSSRPSITNQMDKYLKNYLSELDNLRKTHPIISTEIDETLKYVENNTQWWNSKKEEQLLLSRDVNPAFTKDDLLKRMKILNDVIISIRKLAKIKKLAASNETTVNATTTGGINNTVIDDTSKNGTVINNSSEPSSTSTSTADANNKNNSTQHDEF